MLYCVNGWVVPRILKNHVVFICSSKSPWSPYTTTQSFKAQWITYPTTQCHIPEDLNPQQRQCENLKKDVRFSLFTPWWHIEIKLHSFLTSALQGSEWLTAHPGHFTPQDRNPVPINRTLCGFEIQSGCFAEKKNFLSLPGCKPWTVQSAA